MRLAVNDPAGFPRLCSMWFDFDGESIIAVGHKNALLIQLLEKDGRCGFEIATNTEPYMGVRGQAVASIHKEQGRDLLPSLIEKYIADRHPDLQSWLMNRIDDEYAIKLKLEWLSAWDFSGRMKV
jgi:hypothetical protein